jgi:hypothetical protein
MAGKARKSTVVLFAMALVLSGLSAQASSVLNTPSGGYLLCVKSKTKVITHPGKKICPKGSKKLVIGAVGKDGKTLWNGEKDPEKTLGSPGDMFINSVTKTLFGPKNLDGTWPAGVSMVGPRGDQGPGGGSGPAGTNGTNGQGPVIIKTDDYGPITGGQSFPFLNLQPGTYLLTYSAIIVALDPFPTDAYCAIGREAPNRKITVNASNAADTRKFVTDQITAIVEEPLNINILCEVLHPTYRIEIKEQTLTALRISSTTVQE